MDRIAAHIDILPTMLDACGIAKPDGLNIDGRSLMPLLRGQSNWPDRTLFTQWHRGDEPELFRACAARTQQYKLVNGTELYDLSADPGEMTDIASRRPEVARKLRAETEAWFKDVSSTRGYAPPRIHLGTPHESPTILTRQDWRGEKSGWAADSVGHWEVEVTRQGRYELALLMSQAPGDGVVKVKVGTLEAAQAVKQGAKEARITCELAAGPARLEAVLEQAGKKFGMQYVEVKRT